MKTRGLDISVYFGVLVMVAINDNMLILGKTTKVKGDVCTLAQ